MSLGGASIMGRIPEKRDEIDESGKSCAHGFIRLELPWKNNGNEMF